MTSRTIRTVETVGTETGTVGTVETVGTGVKPPQLRAARARKQSIIKFVILFVTLAFLFVPLLAMLIFTLRHPLSGRWSAAPWTASTVSWPLP